MNKTVNDTGVGFGLSPDLMDNFSNTGRFMVISDGESEELVSTPKRDFLPGDSSDFFIGMFNKSTLAVSINSFGLEVPTVWTDDSGVPYEAKPDVTQDDAYDEVPILGADGEYYYFGQEVKISILEYVVYEAEFDTTRNVINLKSIKKTVPVTMTPQYVLPQDLSDLQRIELVDVPESDPLILEPTDALIFKMHIEFINLEDVDQSMFMGFGPTGIGGRCHRNVYALFNQDFS